MTTLQSTTATMFDASRARQAARSWLARTAHTLRCWVERVRARDALGELDERMLKDVGLTRADIVVEQGKHFWQR